MPVYADIVTEELRFQKEQFDKQSAAYVLRAVIRNRDVTGAFPTDSVANAVLQIEDSADFKVDFVTGRCTGPTDSAGRRLLSSLTDFPAAGTTRGRADRGLSLHFLSLSTSQTFTQPYQDPKVALGLPHDFIPAECILAPGYDFTYIKPYAMNLFLPRKSRLKMQIRNFDSVLPASQFHAIDIFFYGKRMET